MTDTTAREWGRIQAAKAPAWSEERWQRVSTLLGLEFEHQNSTKATRKQR
ncbi:hypothetical protein ACF1BU_02790 [Streptomyces sp. NPDC014724]